MRYLSGPLTQRTSALLVTTALLWCAQATLSTSARAQTDPLPVGTELQVNSSTSGDQLGASVDMRSDGSFVVVWSTEGTEYQISGQRFDSAGNFLGGEFRVDEVSGGYVGAPDVAVFESGGFVVSWVSEFPPGNDSSYGVAGRRFDSAGSPLASEFQINETTSYISYPGAIDADAADRFFVVWSSPVTAGDTDGAILGRLYDAAGTPSPELQVNAYTTGQQQFPDVAFDADGSFKVVWTSDGSVATDNDLTSVQERNFFANGTPGSEGQVNFFETLQQRDPSVAFSSTGHSIVTWTSSLTDLDPTEGIQATVRDSLGLGSEISTLNESTDLFQSRSKSAGTPDGYFATTWQSQASAGSDDDSWSVQGRLIRANGDILSSEFQINTGTAGSQLNPDVAAAGNGRFVAVWSTQDAIGDDSDGYGIGLQLFHFGDLFNDGFESGDTTAWSDQVP